MYNSHLTVEMCVLYDTITYFFKFSNINGQQMYIVFCTIGLYL